MGPTERNARRRARHRVAADQRNAARRTSYAATAPQQAAQRTATRRARNAAQRTATLRSFRISIDNFDESLIEQHNAGTMSNQCVYCGAQLFDDECERKDGHIISSFCCRKGKFASTGAKIYDPTSDVRQRYGNSIPPAMLTIHGEVYHGIGGLMPTDPNDPRKFAQLYIIDNIQEQAAERIRVFQEHRVIRRSLVAEIQACLLECNPLAREFRSKREQIEADRGNESGVPAIGFRLVDSSHTGQDRRLYNVPTCNEIAAFIPDGSQGNNREVLIFSRQQRLQRINELSPHYDALHFVLLFPRGELGWERDIPYRTPQMQQRQRRVVSGSPGGAVIREEDEEELPAADTEPTGRPTRRRRVAPSTNGGAAAVSASATAAAYIDDGAGMDVEADGGADGGEDAHEADGTAEHTTSGAPRAGKPRKTVSHLDWTAFYIQVRHGQSRLSRANRLAHEFIVDQNAKIEGQRLTFIRNNQRQLRQDLYAGVQDAVSQADEAPTDSRHIGRAILPSSFIGGPRHIHSLYQDAMAIVQHHGKPSLFITFTCNPEWDEIQQALLPEQGHFRKQRWEDRPDIVTRVFRIKLKALLKDITEKGVLGRHVAHSYAVEYQKRGLPHAHIVVIFSNEDSVATPDVVDSIVCAELPDKETQPELYAIVTSKMLHGPGGAHNPRLSCMRKTGQCDRKYPWAFREHTTIEEDGYPFYRRRNDGRQHDVKGVLLDNRWVVPYNPALTLRYRAHINVERCGSVKAIKYLHKYIYKGADRAVVETSRQEDEIRCYVEGRYVSVSEACWRIFGFPTHGHYPAVERLTVHLENHQSVVFAANQPPPTEAPMTKLTAWMALNATDEFARTISFPNFPQHFVWNQKNKRWTRRRHGSTIGRVYNVSPAAGERFFLRILLHHIPGAKSFQDLRTVDGVVHSDFRSACNALGLFRENAESIDCLQQAKEWQMPHQMRHLFVELLDQQLVSKPEQLWEQFKVDLAADYIHRWRVVIGNAAAPPRQEDIDRALIDIDDILMTFNKSIEKDFNMLPPRPATPTERRADLEYARVRERETYNTEQAAELASENEAQFNSRQREAFEAIVPLTLAAVSDEQPHPTCFFIDSPGGGGKTFLLDTILASVRSTGRIAVACASTGVAALLLQGGTTAHSRFGIPVPCSPDESSNIAKQTARARILKEAAIIVIDEITQLHMDALDIINRLLQDIMENSRPFGGKTVVFTGDFRQCVPVVPHASDAQAFAASVKAAPVWASVRRLQLDINMRIQRLITEGEDPSEYEAWAAFLLDVGNGTIGDRVSLPPATRSQASDISGLVREVYGTFDPNVNFVTRAILAPRHTDVNAINAIATSLSLAPRGCF
ncbi:unnamed protein product [Vitrella brassicaformis CCMP3155]|uniref:ATP-dependent DNA helicase n=1 Tax=Vitrella brassicaformis (strain CCMP3155) TaxID=1169540 RepID=A0A0G4F3Q2_VITBC|nr:unnamed protein product [Vitrella brassicaformis CCMP3155]|eukprot:CEM06285.1 unnamed protein product [Vitrella brassicaformis CCMP3155]